MEPINVSAITVGERLRSTDNDNIEKLVESITAVGLLQPITVRQLTKTKYKYKLVAGAHRLEAIKRLSYPQIHANIQPDLGSQEANDLADELAEIDENLMRKDLGSIDRNEHLRLRQENRTRDVILKEAEEAKEAAAKEKAETGKVSEKTRSKRRRAVGSHSNLSANQPTVSRKAQAAITDETAAVVGAGKSSVRRWKKLGEDTNKLAKIAGVSVRDLSGTTIDSDTQIAALSKLAKANPTEAKTTIKQAIEKKGSSDKVLATKALADLDNRIKDQEKQKREASKEGRYASYSSHYQSALNALRKTLDMASDRQDKTEYRTTLEHFEALEKTHAGYAAKANLGESK